MANPPFSYEICTNHSPARFTMHQEGQCKTCQRAERQHIEDGFIVDITQETRQERRNNFRDWEAIAYG